MKKTTHEKIRELAQYEATHNIGVLNQRWAGEQQSKALHDQLLPKALALQDQILEAGKLLKILMNNLNNKTIAKNGLQRDVLKNRIKEFLENIKQFKEIENNPMVSRFNVKNKKSSHQSASMR